jgi:hypothetical protein
MTGHAGIGGRVIRGEEEMQTMCTVESRNEIVLSHTCGLVILQPEIHSLLVAVVPAECTTHIVWGSFLRQKPSAYSDLRQVGWLMHWYSAVSRVAAFCEPCN